MPKVSPDRPRPRLRDRLIARSLPAMPRRLVRRFSAPYIAGDSLPDAIAVARALHARGMGTTVDVLGEAITRRDQAMATRDAYLATIAQLAQLPRGRDAVNVSVKLTALGLGIDDELCTANVRDIVRAAGEHGGFVRIDMEDSPWTDQTLDLYRTLRTEGHDNVGVVVQAYLRRSRADVEQLAAMGARVRVVKGIYVEPAEIAFTDPLEVNRSFVELCRMLAEAGCHAAYATHDGDLVRETSRLVRELDVPRDRYEYQMLLGVREELRDELVAQGHPMRVYVPFGAQWYEYSLRRLRENPSIAGHVAADTLGRLLPGSGRRRRGKATRDTAQRAHGGEAGDASLGAPRGDDRARGAERAGAPA